MPIDTYVQLRTPLSVEQLRSALVADPALADLNLANHPENTDLIGSDIRVILQPWEGDEDRVIEDGFGSASLFCMTLPGWGDAGYVADRRILVALLRLVPGDVCLADENNGGPALLRLGGVVYVDPDGFLPEHLANYGYTPKHLVIGIPPIPRTYLQFRTSFSAEQVRLALVHAPSLAGEHLSDRVDDTYISGDSAWIELQPREANGPHAIPHGFDNATVTCLVTQGRGEGGVEGERRVIATLLAAVPGDVCLARQHAPGPQLLRLGTTVYVDPRDFPPGQLTEYGYTPDRLVLGLPPQPW